MRTLLLAVMAASALTLVPAADALVGGVAAPQTYLVGHEPGKRDSVATLVASLGGTVTGSIDALDVLVVASSLDLAGLLDGEPGVSYVETDEDVFIDGAQWDGAQWNGAQWDGAQWDGAQWNGEGGDPGQGDQWGLEAVRAPAAWELEGGRHAANLCVVDSGVDHDHPDLRDNAWTRDGVHGFNAITGGSDAGDDAGHGTHVAGVAAAVRDNGVGVAGVTKSLVMSAKVLGADGQGTLRHLASGLVWCADHGADVALLALSIDGHSRTIGRALDHLHARDVVVVASAGNRGCDGCVNPLAGDPRVLAVAAVGPDHARAPFSATGPEVDLAAPGVDVVSTCDAETYASGSGTSQAAAWVAGAAALLRERDPGLSAGGVRDALTATATDLGPPGRDDATGHGLLDLQGALQAVEG